MRRALPLWLLEIRTKLTHGYAMGDVDADGRSDLIWRDGSSILVRLSDGQQFSTVPFPGNARSLVWGTWNPRFDLKIGDVNNDGAADLIGRSGTDISVALSTKDGFSPQVHWSYWSTPADYRLADVNRDGRADLIGRIGSTIHVGLSTGSYFAPSSEWSVWSTPADYKLADVNGDGCADLVGRIGSTVHVGLSDCVSQFLPSSPWTHSSYTDDYKLADVDGNGNADLVGRTGTSVYVGLSDGLSFASPVIWTGWRAGDYKLADADGLPGADLIAQLGTIVHVAHSTGDAFAPSNVWATTAFTPISRHLNTLYNANPGAAGIASHIANLASMAPRYYSSFDKKGSFDNNLYRSASYIEEQFAALGYVITREPVRLSASMCGANGTCGENIVATKVGTVAPNAFIEFTAHYDGGTGDISQGANDDASGVASIIEVARALAEYPNRHSLRFIAFTGEEAVAPAPGSLQHIDAAREAGEQIICDLNQDTIATQNDPVTGHQVLNLWYDPPMLIGTNGARSTIRLMTVWAAGC